MGHRRRIRRSPRARLAVRASVLAMVAAGLATSAPPVGATTAGPRPAIAAAEPVDHSVPIPVTCESADPDDPVDHTGWAADLVVVATYPDHVPFGATVPVDLTATFAYGGPTGFTSLASRLDVRVSDGFGDTGTGAGLTRSGPMTSAVTLDLPDPLSLLVRGDVGAEMTVVASELTVTATAATPVGSFSTTARCTPDPGAPPSVRAVIDPPVDGSVPGDEFGIIVTRADGTDLFRSSALLDTGDIDLSFSATTSQVESLTGIGSFPGPNDGTAYLALTAAPGPSIGGWPNITTPTMELVLVDPASGLVVWVPDSVPTNGIAMATDFRGIHTVGVLALARGHVIPSGESVLVTWGIRDLLDR